LLLYRQVGDFINLRGLGVHGLSELDAELFPDALELSEVLVVLALVLDLCLDACKGMARQYVVRVGEEWDDAPSKILTAVGKSLTLRAALRAATMTEGAGTKS
jgi:hypothetical protein